VAVTSSNAGCRLRVPRPPAAHGPPEPEERPGTRRRVPERRPRWRRCHRVVRPTVGTGDRPGDRRACGYRRWRTPRPGEQPPAGAPRMETWAPDDADALAASLDGIEALFLGPTSQ